MNRNTLSDIGISLIAVANIIIGNIEMVNKILTLVIAVLSIVYISLGIFLTHIIALAYSNVVNGSSVRELK